MDSLNTSSSPRRCRGTTARGRPCRAWAVRGTDFCAAHSHQAGLNLDPDQPRRKLETIDDLIADMLEKLSFLSDMLDQAQDIDDYLKWLAVYSRSATHVSRLLREKRLLPTDRTDTVMAALGQAVQELGEELGVDFGSV